MSVFFEELVEQVKLVVPVCSTFLLRRGVEITSVIFVGLLGPDALSAAGLASFTSNVTGRSMIIGLGGAITTLAGRFHGSKDREEICNILPRGVLVMLIIICFPITVLWIFSEAILIGLGQDRNLSRNASEYLIALVPSLWAYSISVSITNWLHSQSNTNAVFLIALIVALIHPFSCYIFIYYLDYGFVGAAIASSITSMTELVLLLLYMFCWSSILRDLEFSLSSKCFNEWGTFLKLGIPNMLMMTEWWASEIIIFLSGLLPNPIAEVSAMSIYQNTLSLCFMIPSGVHVAGSTRVSNELGANRPEAARVSSIVCPLLAAGVALTEAIILFYTNREWASLFTHDLQVAELFSSIAPVLFLYVVADGIQSALTGVLKGVGKQSIGGPIVLLSYYVIGLPISAYLGFSRKFDMGIVGLAVGIAVGTCCHMIFFASVVMTIDWSHEAKLAQLVSMEDGTPPLANAITTTTTNSNNNNNNNYVIESADADSDWLVNSSMRPEYNKNPIQPELQKPWHTDGETSQSLGGSGNSMPTYFDIQHMKQQHIAEQRRHSARGFETGGNTGNIITTRGSSSLAQSAASSFRSIFYSPLSTDASEPSPPREAIGASSSHGSGSRSAIGVSHSSGGYMDRSLKPLHPSAENNRSSRIGSKSHLAQAADRDVYHANDGLFYRLSSLFAFSSVARAPSSSLRPGTGSGGTAAGYRHDTNSLSLSEEDEGCLF